MSKQTFIRVGIAMAAVGGLLEFLAIPHGNGTPVDWKLMIPGAVLFMAGIVVGATGRRMP